MHLTMCDEVVHLYSYYKINVHAAHTAVSVLVCDSRSVGRILDGNQMQFIWPCFANEWHFPPKCAFTFSGQCIECSAVWNDSCHSCWTFRRITNKITVWQNSTVFNIVFLRTIQSLQQMFVFNIPKVAALSYNFIFFLNHNSHVFYVYRCHHQFWASTCVIYVYFVKLTCITCLWYHIIISVHLYKIVWTCGQYILFHIIPYIMVILII